MSITIIWKDGSDSTTHDIIDHGFMQGNNNVLYFVTDTNVKTCIPISSIRSFIITPN